MRPGAIAIVLVAALAGCGDDEQEPAQPPERPQRGGPPDAGTRFGHGADDTVVVPERDTTPPAASISAVGTDAVSPSSAGDRPAPVTLDTDRFQATATARDADGGSGRVRLSLVYVVRCGEDERRVTEYRPPAQIASVKIAPGTRVPIERRRSATLRLRVGEGCSAEGDVYAEATNAHGLQAVSRHIRFRHAP